jgi:type IV pilus assembly protein PilW
MQSSSHHILKQKGFTLVELLVSLIVSSLIVIAAASFFLSSTRSRDTQDAAGLLQDNARFITEIMTRNIQQAGWQNYILGINDGSFLKENGSAVNSDGEPDVRGFNNTAAGASVIDNGLNNRSANRVNNSDTLVLRFQGSSTSINSVTRVADGSMIDCAGRPQPEPATLGDRVYSIFEVRSGPGGEPELRCKTGNNNSQPIVRGVETLQLMYGVDTNGDSFADTWCNAAEVGIGRCTIASATTDILRWQLVKAVRVGIVLRTPDPVAAQTSAGTYTPLGVNYTQGSAIDPGSQLVIANDDGRLRQVVTFTVNLRNQL